MAATPSEIRIAVAASIQAIPGPSWSESRFGYEQFGFDANTLTHRSYVVSPLTTADIAGNSRQNASSPAYVETVIGVQFLWVLRSKFPISDRDAAAAAEIEVLKAIKAGTSNGGAYVGAWSSPRYIQTVRREIVGASPHMLTELQWGYLHHLDLL